MNMNDNDTYQYSGWLNSDFFWKRCAAIAGYSSVATIAMWVVGFILGVIGV